MGGQRRGATWGGRDAAAGQRGATWGGRRTRAVGVLVAVSAALSGSLASTGVAGAQDAGPPSPTPASNFTPISQFDVTVEPPVTDTWVPPAVAYDPSTDPYSMNTTTALTGAKYWWNSGYTGAGVDVAVIDTGVSPVAGLDTAGKVIYGPDLSMESQSPNLAQLDTNGHGTFMAGLIAGHDSNLTAPYSAAAASVYRGMAPDARIVALKVANADGGVDVSQVIAAIDWVVQHKNDNGMNIRVLNLSYGTNATQDTALDPLAYAVEQAWMHGIVVVAAAGNSGYLNKLGLSDPARDPYVIGVGGYDSKGTTVKSDDVAGVYTAGTASAADRRPDFVGVGTRLQGLRVPNSFVDSTHPEGRLGDRFFRGSGTSEAAAVTSGTVALILQKYPNLTPDEVKHFLSTYARRNSYDDQSYWGNGRISLFDMASKTPATFAQDWPVSTGAGSLELARGVDHLTNDGVPLAGEIDIFGQPYVTAARAAQEASGASWSGGLWNGSTWSGSSWSGSSWSGSTWSGSTWSGSTWSGSTWSGSTWSGSTWSGSTWSGSSWSGSTWSSTSWT